MVACCLQTVFGWTFKVLKAGPTDNSFTSVTSPTNKITTPTSQMNGAGACAQSVGPRNKLTGHPHCAGVFMFINSMTHKLRVSNCPLLFPAASSRAAPAVTHLLYRLEEGSSGDAVDGLLRVEFQSIFQSSGVAVVVISSKPAFVREFVAVHDCAVGWQDSMVGHPMACAATPTSRATATCATQSLAVLLAPMPRPSLHRLAMETPTGEHGSSMRPSLEMHHLHALHGSAPVAQC